MTVQGFLAETVFHTQTVDRDAIDYTVVALQQLREARGRVFVIGNGGGAAHASHFAADLRKIAKIEAYAWGDNVSDVTAWTNDASWDVATASWLDACRFKDADALFVFSVGGASDSVSANLKWAMSTVYTGTVLGIVGKNGGELARYGKPIILGTGDTLVVEGLQSVVAHCIIGELRCE